MSARRISKKIGRSSVRVRREAQAKLDALVDNVAANLRGKLAAYAAAFEKDPEAIAGLALIGD